MTEFFTYVVRGIPIGCVYALMAVGLVLTYKTSGVFNLAYGAQAFVSGVVFYKLRVSYHWGVVPSAAIAILVVGPALGALLGRGLFRFLRTSTALARLVTSLGLLIAIPAFVQVFVGQSPLQHPPGLAPGSTSGGYPGQRVPVYHFGSFYWDQNQVITIVATVAVAAGLTAMFRYSGIGLRMRAVAESTRMTELSGVNAERVSGFSWMFSGLLAGLTGVLMAPLFEQVVADFYFSLLVAAIAACVFGRLSSIPLTFIGGLGLGALEQIFSGYLPHDSVLFTGLRPSLPFVVLVILLLFLPGLARRREMADPMSGVDAPPPAPTARSRPTWAAIGTRVAGFGGIVALVIFALFVLDAVWLGRVTEGVIYSIIFLSITIVTGMAGQISLCQATFAGVGAFTVGQLVSNQGMSVILAIVLGTILAAAIGAIVAIPALRLAGIYVALATLAFALLFDNVLVPLSWVGGGSIAKQVPRPVLGPWDFGYPNHNRAFFILCLVVLGIAGGAVWLIRMGTTGRFLNATRGSEKAASAVGINPVRAKITAFAVSGALAGLGGGLLATYRLSANPTDFVYLYGLFWVLVVVTIGSQTVFGAIVAGFSFALVPEIINAIGVSNQLLWSEVLFGLGIITYVKYPEGILEVNTRGAINFVARLFRLPSSSDDEPTASDGGTTAPTDTPTPIDETPSGMPPLAGEKSS